MNTPRMCFTFSHDSPRPQSHFSQHGTLGEDIKHIWTFRNLKHMITIYMVLKHLR